MRKRSGRLTCVQNVNRKTCHPSFCIFLSPYGKMLARYLKRAKSLPTNFCSNTYSDLIHQNCASKINLSAVLNKILKKVDQRLTFPVNILRHTTYSTSRNQFCNVLNAAATFSERTVTTTQRFTHTVSLHYTAVTSEACYSYRRSKSRGFCKPQNCRKTDNEFSIIFISGRRNYPMPTFATGSYCYRKEQNVNMQTKLKAVRL